MHRSLVRLALLSIVGAVMVSCTIPKFEVIGDETENSTIYRLKNLSPKTDGGLLGPAGHLKYALEMHLSWESNDTTFFLKNDVLSVKPVYLDYGDSLVLRIDGKETELFCSESKVPSDGECIAIKYFTYCFESGSFELDRSTVAAMAAAKSVEFDLNTPDGVYTSELYEGSHNGVKEFCKRYLR